LFLFQFEYDMMGPSFFGGHLFCLVVSELPGSVTLWLTVIWGEVLVIIPLTISSDPFSFFFFWKRKYSSSYVLTILNVQNIPHYNLYTCTTVLVYSVPFTIPKSIISLLFSFESFCCYILMLRDFFLLVVSSH
jgi:hypothetical protein